MSQSETIRVAFQGSHGAYSEEAIFAYFGKAVQSVPRNSFELCASSCGSGDADYGMLPVENILAGPVHGNYDLILKYNLHIVGEYSHRISHCLLANHGVDLSKIRRVMSHYMALGQCQNIIGEQHWQAEEYSDTASSAKYIKDTGETDVAAIASKGAAGLYDLQVLQEGIEDEKDNRTRFLVLSRTMSAPPSDLPCKTTIAVVPAVDTSGDIAQCLRMLAEHKLHVVKVETRCLRSVVRTLSNHDTPVHWLKLQSLTQDWRYMYFIDFLGSVSDSSASAALARLKAIVPYFHLLGSYSLLNDSFVGSSPFNSE